MWWTEPRARLGATAILAAGALAACTTPLSPTTAMTSLTPTEQYTVQVQQVPDQLALALHAEGLSDNQRAAIEVFAGRWRAAGPSDVSIRTPVDGDPQATDRMTAELISALQSHGVPADRLRLGPYDAGAPGGPLLASFLRYEAQGPNCEGGWDNLGATGDNGPSTHFGCANTANFAAMVADPRDLLAPAASDPADASRRSNVLTRYRLGQITSTARDDQAVGAVSSAVQ